jgi:hypothetical protein
MKIIIPIAGIIKLIFSLIICVGCLSAIIDTGVFSGKLKMLFPVMSLLVVVGSYLYYTIRTAFWNLHGKSYRVNLPLVVGVIIHIGFIIYSAIDFVRFHAIDKVIMVMPFILIGFLIGVYDFRRLLKNWKSRNA